MAKNFKSQLISLSFCLNFEFFYVKKSENVERDKIHRKIAIKNNTTKYANDIFLKINSIAIWES